MLDQLDTEYRERTKHIGGNYKPQQCGWNGCQKRAVAQGFCHSHYTYLTRGTLLKLDLSDRTHETKAELMREFEQVAERFGMTPDELMTAAFFTVLKEGRKYENTNH